MVEKNRNSHKLLIYIINVTTKNFRSLGLSKSVQGHPKVKDKKTVIFHYLYIYSKTSKQDTNTWHLYEFDKVKVHLLCFLVINVKMISTWLILHFVNENVDFLLFYPKITFTHLKALLLVEIFNNFSCC